MQRTKSDRAEPSSTGRRGGGSETETRPDLSRKVDSRAMREVNRSIILDLIRAGSQLSRTELAKRSELTKPTVSAIVEELISEGMVHEVGFSKSEPTGGRRARLLEFNPDCAAYAGVRLGVNAITVALSDGLGRVL